MKKLIALLSVSSLLLIACGDQEVESESNPEINEIENEIVFISGTSENIIEPTEDNYVDITGEALGSDYVYVIYNNTVIDNIPVTLTGEWEYYNNGGNETIDLYFSTDDSLSFGDRDVDVSSLENGIMMTYIPNDNSDHYASDEETNDDDDIESTSDYIYSDTFSVGETIIFESDLEITINSVEITDEEPYSGPVENYFVRVDFTIDNLTDESIDFNSHYIEVYDGDRNKGEINSKDFYSESIAVGMKSSGVAYYETLEDGPFTVIVGAGTWVSE